MSLKIAFLLAGLAGAVGILIGYYLRLIISLGKKGSVELEVKQLTLDAKEAAKKITAEAETKALETMQELRREMKEREDKIKSTEDRLIKKEDTLDKRQGDIDREVESIKQKIVEIKEIREKAEKLGLKPVNTFRSTAEITVVFRGGRADLGPALSRIKGKKLP